MGKVFWASALARDGGRAARRALHALERKEFVRRERRPSIEGESEYAFRHLLVRDVAYGQIPRAARADKHGRMAEWIAQLGRPEDYAELVAHHYLAALELTRAAGGDVDSLAAPRARSVYGAGDRAFALNAWTAALAVLRAGARALSQRRSGAPPPASRPRPDGTRGRTWRRPRASGRRRASAARRRRRGRCGGGGDRALRERVGARRARPRVRPPRARAPPRRGHRTVAYEGSRSLAGRAVLDAGRPTRVRDRARPPSRRDGRGARARGDRGATRCSRSDRRSGEPAILAVRRRSSGASRSRGASARRCSRAA